MSIVVVADGADGARALAAAAFASVMVEMVDSKYCAADVEVDCDSRVGVYEGLEASGEPRLLKSTLDD